MGSSMTRVDVDWLRCDGHGVCAEVAPEVFALDDWGYPIVADEPLTRAHEKFARRAASACPAVALRLARD
jgi:ferredoxin